jgi:hypothetical protein
VDAQALLLLVTIATFTVYVVGVGGTTATAIRAREAWRHRKLEETALSPRLKGEVMLSAPSLSRGVKRLRVVGWVAFVPSLALALVAARAYPWVSPSVLVSMVVLNAFYFTAMQNMGEQLVLVADGFRIGAGGSTRSVRWVHVTEFTGARVGPFTGAKMAEADEWQDPKRTPNVVFYRLNRALVNPRKTLLDRITGFSYYDGVIRNGYGFTTERLVRVLREWQRQAFESEGLPPGPANKSP